MWTIGSLKPSGFEHLKTGRRRGLAIEYTLVALMVALQHFRSCSRLGQKPIRSHIDHRPADRRVALSSQA